MDEKREENEEKMDISERMAGSGEIIQLGGRAVLDATQKQLYNWRIAMEVASLHSRDALLLMKNTENKRLLLSDVDRLWGYFRGTNEKCLELYGPPLAIYSYMTELPEDLLYLHNIQGFWQIFAKFIELCENNSDDIFLTFLWEDGGAYAIKVIRDHDKLDHSFITFKFAAVTPCESAAKLRESMNNDQIGEIIVVEYCVASR